VPKAYIRIWQELDVEFVKSHLLIIGDLTGDCANCKQIGIDYRLQKSCPNCQAEFKYISSRATSGASAYSGLVHKINKIRPDLIFVDLNDFKHAAEKNKAREFFQ
jgi:hypothetical protein